MNRIYQGRVTRVEIPDGNGGWQLLGFEPEEIKQFENERERLRPLTKQNTPEGKEARNKLTELNRKLNEPWQTALWKHHELFQDAVNYYTLALAAMAEGLRPDTIEGQVALKWRTQVKDSWNKAKRKAVVFEGPHQRVAKLLGLNLAKSNFDDCLARLLNETPSSAEQRAKALLQLLEEADKNDLNQVCVARLPWLCTAHGDLDATPKSVSQRQEIEMLQSVRRIHEATIGEFIKITRNLNVGCFLAQPPSSDLSGEAAIKEAKHQFAAAMKKAASLKKIEGKFKASILQQGKNLQVPNLGRKPKGAYPYALVFKLFPVRETWEALKDKTAGSYKRALKQVDSPQVVVRDFLAEVRTNQDQPLFDYFSNIAFMHEQHSKDRAVWFEFDLAAFIEAIKSPHRYFQDTIKRDADAQKIREKLQTIDPEGKWIAISEMTSKLKKKSKTNDSADDEEDEAVRFTFEDDRRIKLIRQLVTDDKGGLAYLVEAETPEMDTGKVEYTIQERTLRGWSKIRDGWRKLTDNKEWPKLSQKEQEEKLWAVVVAEQGEHRDDFGSSALYKMLTQPKYHAVWRDKGSQDDHPDDPLRAWMKFTDLRMELKDKEQPIRFTPAHAVHSPRYFIVPKTGRFGLEHECGAMAFAAGIVIEEGGKYQPIKARIFYSAPRLRRDELRRDEETDLTTAKWSQPMMKALGFLESDTTDFSNCRITLQPESMKDIQLTFPVPVKIDKLQKQLGHKDKWDYQIFGKNKQMNFAQFNYSASEPRSEVGLRWPSDIEFAKEANKPRKREPIPWHQKLDHFTCLSVDLGQRDAGAYALLEARANDDFGKKPSRFIGETPGKKWRAALKASGLLRLSGEDRKEWREQSSLDHDKEARFAFREELFGERGRYPTEMETKQCRELLLKFGVKEEELMPKEWEKTLSFPEQNDKLLIAARRAQSYVVRLHRWCWFLANDKKSNKALEEIAEAKDERLFSMRWLVKEGKQKELSQLLQKELSEWLERLPVLLEQMAQRCLPLKGRSWKWVSNPVKSDCFILDQNGPAMPNASMKMSNGKIIDVTWIRGQRGLSFERIEQIEELRRRFQSLNQILRRKIGEPALKKRDDSVPDPCPDLLEKLDNLKEQRVNQTAHMILAEALGVRLTKPPANKSDLRHNHDQHGVYERFRDPVDFIVIEDLSRYRASQGRAPRENSRLMKWCHRAVRNKLKELCEPFGIPVVETPAAYSSRFCSRSGVAGFRAVEVHPGMKNDFPWSWHLRRLQLYRDNPKAHPLSEEAQKESKHVEMLFQQLEEINKDVGGERPKWRTLFAPMIMGPIFIPICNNVSKPDHPKLEPAVVQSDINAAINLGLRAIADPRLWNISPRLRTERIEKGDGLIAREKRKYGEKTKKPLTLSEQAKPSKGDARQPNFFYDAAACAKWGHATIEDPINNNSVKLVAGKALWRTVNENQWVRVAAINTRRLKAWNKK